VIDLEKFHVNGEEGIRALCDWLGIEFDECLLESSFNGRQWAGNATSQNKISGLNPNIAKDAWRFDLPAADIDCIEVMLPGTLRYLGYQTQSSNRRLHYAKIKERFRYRNSVVLFYHCFIHGAKNPFAAFFRLLRQTASRLRKARPVAGLSRQPLANRRLPAVARGGLAVMVADARKVLRKTGVLVRVGVQGVGLTRKFYGKGLASTLDEMAGQQRRLLEISLPANVLMD
jgi:hypothetical protein